MVLLLVSAALLLAALAVERVRLDRCRAAIPVRVAVTGTRGKTTVTRLLASVLGESGRSVLAKTTGSEPCLVLPDGTVEPIRRRGRASILEQIALLRRGARLGVDAVVAEVMSIHAENHVVESRTILVPGLVLVTNFRVDHTEAAGDTPEDVATLLTLDVPEGATVFVPEAEALPSFQMAIEGVPQGGVADLGRTRVVEIPSGTSASVLGEAGENLGAFAENLDLVVAAARFLGVDDAAVRRGVERARHDVGALRVWKVEPLKPQEPVPLAGRPRGGAPQAETGAPASAYLVNAFAANDPESTMRIHARVMSALAPAWGASPDAQRGGPAGRAPRCVGLLSLRADRGDRTLQWADALGSGLLERFDVLLVTGLHARALARRVQRVARRAGRDAASRPPIRVVADRSARRLTERALSEVGPAGGVVLGFGNIGGVGTELVEHWSHAGQAVAHGH